MESKKMDRLAVRFMQAMTIACVLLLFFMVFIFAQRSMPIISEKGIGGLFSGEWKPMAGKFGITPFIAGTIWSTLTAMAIAVPLCLLASIYLAEYAGRRLAEATKPLIDLLAGIPSVVYGLCGVLVLVPLVKDFIAPAFGIDTSGYTLLTGGMVLAIMVSPIIISISRELIDSVPDEMREASLALGATRWQTTKHVVLRSAAPGIVGAVILGFSRAFGETMAVMMVIGNVPNVFPSLFEPSYPLPALIANNYGEMMSIPLYDSALFFAALLLLGVVLAFSALGRIALIRIERRAA